MVAVKKHMVVSGLDVGTSKVCCLIGEIGSDGNLEIIGKGSAPSLGVRKGVVVDISETVRSIQSAVSEAERGAGIKVHSVFVGVTGDHISSVNSHGVITLAHEPKEVVEEDVRRAVEAAKVVSLPSEREVIHVIPRGFTLDGQAGVKNPVGMLGMRLEVNTHIVTGMSTFLHNLTKCIETAGLEIEENGLVLQPLASSLSVLNEAEKELGILMVDLGGGTTDIAVFRNRHIFHTSALPLGGNHITHDLAVAFRLSPEEAERIKVNYGHAIPSQVQDDDRIEITTLSGSKEILSRRIVAEKIAPRVEELFTYIRHEIEQLPKDSSLAGVTLTGGTSMLPGIIEIGRDILKYPVRIGYPQSSAGSTITELQNPTYSTGVGLVIYGATSLQHRKIYRRRETFISKAFRSLFKEFF